METDAIAKPPAEIMLHPRSSRCSSLTAAAQPHESWFTTEILRLGVISSESARGSILGLRIRPRVMARRQPHVCRAVYFSGWDHRTRKREAGAYLACQMKQ